MLPELTTLPLRLGFEPVPRTHSRAGRVISHWRPEPFS
jgi:hypothetical protein